MSFDAFNWYIQNVWNNHSEKFKGMKDEELLAGVYEMAYPLFEASAGHYFRSVYNIIKFVDQSSIENKRIYSNLVRAQLSSFELVLLFYNGLSKYGRPKFKPLIERYALLKSLNTDLLLDKDKYRHLYEVSAYQ